jgi:hypothetical protein
MYAVSTTVFEATNEPRLSGRASASDAGLAVDGMDPLAVYLTMQQAPSTCARARVPCGGGRGLTATSIRTARFPASPSAPLQGGGEAMA